MTKVNTFTVAGVSALNGVAKVRFSNDMKKRMFMLAYSGHVDIALVELTDEMTKLDAAIAIQTMDEFAGEVQQAAIADYIEKNTAQPAKPRGRPMKLPTLDAIPTRVAGKFIKKVVREEMLAELIADTIAAKDAAAAKRATRAAAKAADDAAIDAELAEAAADDAAAIAAETADA